MNRAKKYNRIARKVQAHVEGSLVLCFCGAAIYCAKYHLKVLEKNKIKHMEVQRCIAGIHENITMYNSRKYMYQE
jgi:hypothetical protein